MLDIIMPFGKFKGELLVDLPSDYLYWLAQNIADNAIADAADKEHSRRTTDNEHWYE